MFIKTFKVVSFTLVSAFSMLLINIVHAAPQIAIVPDTQNYLAHEPHHHIVRQQIQWVADNVEAENLVFMTHLGDIVATNRPTVPWEDQWPIANDVFEVLKERLPYSIAYGNHDFDTVGRSSEGALFAQKYFGPARYESESWFLGASDDGANFAQVFDLSGVEILHIAFKFRPDEESYRWAQRVVEANPKKPTIVSAHAYLTDSGTARRSNEPVAAGYDPIGRDIWDSFIGKNNQVFMVIGAHNHNGENITVSGEFNEDGEYHQVSQNDAGNSVYELLTNYQDYPNGGDGWLQLMSLDIDKGRIEVRTYSPFLEKYQDDTGSAYSWDVDLKARWGIN